MHMIVLEQEPKIIAKQISDNTVVIEVISSGTIPESKGFLGVAIKVEWIKKINSLIDNMKEMKESWEMIHQTFKRSEHELLSK